VSAKIIPFNPRRNRRHGVIDFSVSASAPDDLVMDHADTAPCEYVMSDERDPAFTGDIDA